MERPWGQVAGRRQVSQSWTSRSISGWDNLSPILTAEGAAAGAGAAGGPVVAQPLHLRLGQPVAHLYGRVAGDGRQDAVLASVAGVGALDGREGGLEGAGHVPVRERGDHGGHAYGAGAERLDLEAV